MQTSIVYSRKLTKPTDTGVTQNFQGVRLDLEVTASSLIDKCPFIFQRMMSGPGITEFNDYFYSVASVSQMEDLLIDNPGVDEVFYRSSKVNLVFATQEEAAKADQDIASAIAQLCIQNDISLQMNPTTVVGYPADAALIYYGTSEVSTLTGTDITSLLNSPSVPLPITAPYTANPLLLEYLYIAWPAAMGEATFTINGAPVTMVKSTQSLINSYGLAMDYLVYHSPTVYTDSVSHTLVATPVA